jgi:hypothetical protein
VWWLDHYCRRPKSGSPPTKNASGGSRKKSSCEGVMPAIPKCYMVKGQAARLIRDGLPIGWPFCRSAKLGILWPLSGGKAMRVLRVLIAMALASAMMGPEGKCEPSWFRFSVPRRPFWHEIDVVMPDFRGANRGRCVSYVTLRWLSKKCTCAGLNCGPRRASR